MFLGIRVTIGAPGFEPGTSCSQSRRATGLRHTPSLPANNLDALRRAAKATVHVPVHVVEIARSRLLHLAELRPAHHHRKHRLFVRVQIASLNRPREHEILGAAIQDLDNSGERSESLHCGDSEEG